MASKSTGKPVCLVVGAGDALGGAIARRFAREGYHACVARRTADKLADLVGTIEKAGGSAAAYGCDARREDQVVTLFEQIEAEKPDDLFLAFRSARGANRLALALLADGRPAEARSALEPSLRKHRALLAQEDNANHRYSLVWTLTVTGRAERLLGHDDLARRVLEEAVQAAERLLPSDALNHLRAAAEALQEHAEAVTGAEQCRSLRRVHEIWSEWKATTSPWVEARRQEAGERAASCPLTS